MMKLLNYIEKEWDVIMATPFTFIIIFILACTVAYIAAKWRYGKVIELKEERYNFLKERYDARDAQLEKTIKDFKSKGSVQAEDSNTQDESIRVGLSFEIDQIFKKLQIFWEEYQINSKDSWKYGGVVTNTNPLTTSPVQFKSTFPELHQEVLKDARLIEVREFYYKIEDLELIYKELRSQPKKDFELTEQFETLIAEILEHGNPLKT